MNGPARARAALFLKSSLSSGMWGAWLLVLFLVMWGGNAQIRAENYNGTYRGTISGDLEGTFTFTITNNHDLHGTLTSGSIKTVIGIDGFLSGDTSMGFFNANLADTSIGENYRSWPTGELQGRITGKNGSGTWELTILTDDNRATRKKGTWRIGDAKAPEPAGPILECSCQLGHEIPLLVTDARPVALRLAIRVAEPFRKRFSIAEVTYGARNPAQGHFAIVMDDTDGFYLYADSDQDLFQKAPAGARELVFDVPYANFGQKQAVLLPKNLTAHLSVTLLEGTAKRVEKLDVPVHIRDLFTAGTIRCRRDWIPTLRGEKLPRAATARGCSGDELVVPPEATVQVKFLDGSAVTYFNRDDSKWTLTMRAGRFDSPDASRFTSNSWEIKALIDQGLASGAESTVESGGEKGLELLLRNVASRSAPGMVMKISQFFGASSLGGEKVAVRLRSRVGVSLYRSGRIVVRNFEGSPELIRQGKPPVAIPVGSQVAVDRGGLVRPVAPIPAGHPSVLAWSGEAGGGQASGSSKPVGTARPAEPRQTGGAGRSTPDSGQASSGRGAAPRTGTPVDLFDSFNTLAVENRPRGETRFTLRAPSMITTVLTYHYNRGRGQIPGTVRLVAADGRSYGPWQASGMNGDTFWKVEPQRVIPAGTYTVVDSDPSTWSCNAASGGCGFAKVTGYEDRGEGSSRFGNVLGKVLTVREVAGRKVYDGVWTRREGTDVFDAVWNGSIRDEIEIESVHGNRVTFFRRGNRGRYTGTVSADGRRILSGTASWYAPGWSWSATVSGR